GGAGGAGGGGAGGISVAVVWKGTAAPTLDGSAKVTLGNKGTKGAGGKPGTNDGIDGVAQNTLEVK
ncbi:MAG: PE-PGRS family protein, partial [Myxococcales bacterium]|nr:PE-PGRS family protein [Myxococcales bacterium]